MICLETSSGGKTPLRVTQSPEIMLHGRVSRHIVLCRKTPCLSFRYNKQLISKFGGKHEDLFRAEHPCHLELRLGRH